MADYEALKAELDAMSAQLNALEVRLQRVNAESVEEMKAEVKKLIEEHLAAYMQKAGRVADAAPRCLMRWRAGVIHDPENPQPPNGARCVLPLHDRTTPCQYTEPPPARAYVLDGANALGEDFEGEEEGYDDSKDPESGP